MTHSGFSSSPTDATSRRLRSSSARLILTSSASATPPEYALTRTPTLGGCKSATANARKANPTCTPTSLREDNWSVARTPTLAATKAAPGTLKGSAAKPHSRRPPLPSRKYPLASHSRSHFFTGPSSPGSHPGCLRRSSDSHSTAALCRLSPSLSSFERATLYMPPMSNCTTPTRDIAAFTHRARCNSHCTARTNVMSGSLLSMAGGTQAVTNVHAATRKSSSCEQRRASRISLKS